MIETDDEERWITIGSVPPSKKRDRRTGETVNVPGRKGKHVKIDENGNIVAGLGGKFGNLNEIGTKGNVGKGGAGSSGSGNSSKQPPEPPKPKEPPVVLNVDELPDFFKKGKGKDTQTVLYNYINNKKGASESCKRLMGALKNVFSHCNIDKITYTKDKHYIETPLFPGISNVYSIHIPSLGDGSSQEEIDAGVSTIIHEFTHVLDFASLGWFSAKSIELNDAMQDIEKEGIKYGTETQDLFTTFNKYYDNLVKETKKKISEEDAALKKKYIPDGNIYKHLDEYNQYVKEYNAMARKYEREIKMKSEAYGGGGPSTLQGIYDSLSKGKFRAHGIVKFGHSLDYFQKDPKARNEEVIADYVALNIVRPDLADLLRKDQPKLCKALDNVIDKMVERLK